MDGNEKYFCSNASLEQEESLMATASNTTFFVLVGYNKPFPAKVADANLPANWFPELLKLVNDRGGKVILIRTEEKVLMVVDPLLNAYFKANHSSPSFTAASLFSPFVKREWERNPFFLVCTNGTKDKCCSYKGLPVFIWLKMQPGITVYQCSHVGGDRFAANVLLMPYGIYYGRVQADEMPGIINALRHGNISLHHYRGSSSFNFIHQAAEHFLRNYLQVFHLKPKFIWQKFTETEPETFEVKVALFERSYQMLIRRKPSAGRHLLTCKSAAAEPYFIYELADIFETTPPEILGEKL